MCEFLSKSFILMQTIKKLCLKSRYAFSTTQHKIVAKCYQRNQMSNYFKNMFLQNLDNIALLLPKADLRFATLVGYNFTQFDIDDEKLRELIIHRITQELKDLTPDLVYDLMIILRNLSMQDNFELFDTIRTYCENFYFLFDQDQLDSISHVFFGIDGKYERDFGVGNENPDATNRLKNQQTANILDLYNINVPKDELAVIIHPFNKVIEVQFLKLQKTLTLAGVIHEDWNSIRKAKELIEDNGFDFYLMELGPLKHSDIIKHKKGEQ